MDILHRFRSKVEVMESGCHEWRSTLHRDGYGKFWHNGGQIQAHRMAYLLFVGEIHDRLWVLHKCDNRKCVNPDHLYLGDNKQNCKDRTDRLGYGCPKIPSEAIPLIRSRYASGETQQHIAESYCVDQTHISRIVRGTQRVRK